jgi:hypothetical protein
MDAAPGQAMRNVNLMFPGGAYDLKDYQITGPD